MSYIYKFIVPDLGLARHVGRPLESLHFFKSLQALQRGALSTATETATMQFHGVKGWGLKENAQKTKQSCGKKMMLKQTNLRGWSPEKFKLYITVTCKVDA